MTPSPLTLLFQAVSALAIAFFSAWLTVKLSQGKFRAERLWDRKIVAYERVIEAFHKSKKFSDENLDAMYSNSELADDRDKELRRLAHEAREEIQRTADIGSFTISEKALKLLADYQQASGDDKDITSWHEHLQHDYAVLDKYMKLFIAEAKRDLEQ